MKHLTDKEINSLSLKIVELLNGVPIGQALFILTKEAPIVLKDGHLVDTSNERFVSLKEAFKKHYSSELSSAGSYSGGNSPFAES